jgi:hypothetical protein
VVITGALTLTHGSTTLIYAATGRTKLRIRNGSTIACWIGNSSVASGNGWPLSFDPSLPADPLPKPEVTLQLQAGDSIYGTPDAAVDVVVQFIVEG